MTIATRKKRRMLDFVINEISCVDNPAQTHAQMTIMKRADDEEEYDEMQFEKIIPDQPLSFDSLEAAMAHLRKAHGMSALEAMENAAQLNSGALLKRYNAEGERIAKVAQDAAAPKPISKAVTDFNKCVTEIMARDKVSKLLALERATREFPTEFRAYQEV